MLSSAYRNSYTPTGQDRTERTRAHTERGGQQTNKTRTHTHTEGQQTQASREQEHTCVQKNTCIKDTHEHSKIAELSRPLRNSFIGPWSVSYAAAQLREQIIQQNIQVAPIQSDCFDAVPQKSGDGHKKVHEGIRGRSGKKKEDRQTASQTDRQPHKVCNTCQSLGNIRRRVVLDQPGTRKRPV